MHVYSYKYEWVLPVYSSFSKLRPNGVERYEHARALLFSRGSRITRRRSQKSFSDNRINSLGFFGLTEDELKELIPVVGDRVAVRLKQKLETEREEQQSGAYLDQL